MGSCHCNYSFNPEILDRNLGCSSYNLSGPEINWQQRKYLLEDMTDNNPIDTLVIEIAYDNLSRGMHEGEYGTVYFLPRMKSVIERIAAFFCWIEPDNYDKALYSLLDLSIAYDRKLISNLLHSEKNEMSLSVVLYDRKGYIPYEPVSQALSCEEIRESFNSVTVGSSINRATRKTIDRVINECKDNGIEVVFVVTPISPAKLWTVNNFDEFRENMESLSEEYGCAWYDFNLLKSYSELFSDEDSFHDEFHLSTIGSETFNNCFCEVYSAAQLEEDVSELFYESYSEAKRHLTYWEQYVGQ